MIVYRLTKGKYKDKISGKGAELFGGRWNNKGYRMVYTSESRALCTAEIAVNTPLGIMPKDYFLQTIEIPKIKILEIHSEDLETNWRDYPHVKSTKLLGDSFIIENDYLVMKVPSSVIQDEYNFLLNPNHPSYSKLVLKKVELFEFDRRLFK